MSHMADNKQATLHLDEYKGDGQVKAVQNAALTDAITKQKPSLWTRRMFQLYFFLLIATLNSCINGYDGSLMGAINSYESYRVYFGFDPKAGTPGTGIVYAIYTIGNIVGSFAAGPACDKWGRKWGMFIGALIIVIGTCIQAPSKTLGEFMAGRFILGFGVAISASAGPAYASEMSHPAFRGVMTGIYNTFWFMGGIPGTFVAYGTHLHIKGENSWRIPIWLQMFFSGLVLLAAPWIPESPRWLIANDRHEEALEVMAKYHGEGNRENALVQLQYKEMCADISRTASDKRWWDYRELFNTPEVRYRTMLAVSMGFFGQWSGNGPVSYYYPQMLQGAGVNDVNTQLLYNGMQNVVSFGGAVTGAFITDRIGRRKQLLTSTAIIVCLFAIIMALNATNLVNNPKYGHGSDDKFLAKSAGQAKAIIALIFIFGFVFGAGWTPLQALYPVECLRYESRAKGMGLYNIGVNIAGFYNTFVTGIAFSSAGWKYYFLFIFWDLFEFAFIYFFYVETKGRTLEELTEIFRGKNRVKRSKQKTEVVLHHGEGVEVIENAKTLA